tara:strand:- start:438 stop:635 length:198 start_codon:yes stop_codon:yes gene_type:complete
MSEENSIEPSEDISEEKFDVIYRCLRCGNQSMLAELSRLPEIKCICGFRVFTKERSGLVKTVKAI